MRIIYTRIAKTYIPCDILSKKYFELQLNLPGISHSWFNIYLCFLFHPTLRAGKTLTLQATVTGVYFHALPQI